MNNFERILSESKSIEKDLDPNKKIVVKGVKGTKSKPFVKKFKNMPAYDKWADSDDFDDYEVYQIMNENVFSKIIKDVLREQKGKIEVSYRQKQNGPYHQTWFD